MNEQKRTKGASLLQNPLKIHKCTVWPRNEPRFQLSKGPEVLQIQLADVYRGYLVSTWGSTE